MHDIAIVGGGPGGLCAAARLAARGYDVVVLEEHAAAGDPVHCTGVLASEAFDEFDAPRSAILNPLSTAPVFGPSRPSVAHTTPRTEAVVIDRRVFDRALCERASLAGVEIRVGERIADVRVEADRVVLALSEGEVVSARACVLACGASYVLQRRLEMGMPP